MMDSIKNEEKMRKERMQELEDFINQDTELTTKFLDKFERDATEGARIFLTDLERELTNRFEHQDNMLNNMSRFVGKFQETLKIFGKDV